MRIRVLGASAGGGFPQWNCSCRNCASVREGRAGFTARSQSQVALAADPKNPRWHLLNGSPDLRQQILNYPDMLPSLEDPRRTPIQSMTITNADIDHTLGLILLRESARLRVQSTAFVREALLEGNAYFNMLKQTPDQIDWRAVENGDAFELRGPDNEGEGLNVKAIGLDGHVPFWAKDRPGGGDLPVMGLVIDAPNGGRFGYFPCVGKVPRELLATFATCDILFFDGTFWTDDEIQKIKGGKRSGKDMGHVAMSGEGGALQLLKGLPAKTKKYFIHINNTNPALDENGSEYAQLRAAGWDTTRDGLELDL